MGGKIFDWLRMLYERMDYYVRHGDMESSHFRALVGLLTGDPASPTLWNIFLSDLILLPDFEDVFLAGVRISLMAQADDLLMVSLSVRGLRVKLGTLERWCAVNFILVNLVKTIILIFGPYKTPLPTFELGGTILSVKTDEKYVGINLRTDTRNILADHYDAKARTEDIEDYAKLVHKINLEWLQGELNSSEKLYLLHGRREPQKDKPPTQVTSCMRHYLSLVKTQTHREALTSLLLSTHLLAVEILRYVDHAHQPVDRADRLCRLCKREVETPEHALITCVASSALVDLRRIFLTKLFSELPNLRGQMAELSNTEFLKAIIYPRATNALVAKYAFDVLEVFYAVPVFRLAA